MAPDISLNSNDSDVFLWSNNPASQTHNKTIPRMF